MAKLPTLPELSNDVNIANYLNDTTLADIGSRVVQEYEEDRESRREWEEMYIEALKAASQTREPKNFPWPNAASVKYPLLPIASIQFAARAYPEIIQDGKVAGCRVVGRDPDGTKQLRADRISLHMSYQLCEQIESWDSDTDRLLHVLPIAGVCWRKTYYDPLRGPRSEFILPLDVVVHYHTKSLEEASRITHIFPLTENRVVERQRSGEFLDVDLGFAQIHEGVEYSQHDVPHLFVEQHRFWDLDDDGYAEPYIVTVCLDTKQVVRSVARYDEAGIDIHEGKILKITPIHYFTKYSFIPAPDGSFYDIGFGALLNPLGQSINTLINQLLDSGTLANTGGGFIGRGARFPGGNMGFKPGEWKPIDVQGSVLRDAIVPLPQSQPSNVLFQLLSLLIDVTKQLSTVSNEMTGSQTSPSETATATMARVEQGMKLFSAIHKRIYRSLTQELKKLYRYNRLYLKQAEYSNIVDDEAADVKADYEDASIDVRPISDPNMTTDIQRMLRAQASMTMLQQVPGANLVEMARRGLEAMHEVDIEKLLPDPNAPPAPDPVMMKLQAEQQMAQAAQQAELMKSQAEMQLKAGELAAKTEMEREKAKQEFQAKNLELQMKATELQEKNRMEQAKLDFEREKRDMDAMRLDYERDFREKELAAKFEFEQSKFDNSLKSKEAEHGMNLNHQVRIKELDDKEGKEEVARHRDMMAKASDIMTQVAEKHAAPKKLIRDDKGIITHVDVGGDLHEVKRGKTGMIEEIRPASLPDLGKTVKGGNDESTD